MDMKTWRKQHIVIGFIIIAISGAIFYKTVASTGRLRGNPEIQPPRSESSQETTARIKLAEDKTIADGESSETVSRNSDRSLTEKAARADQSSGPVGESQIALKQLEDFPCPVQGIPGKEAGNYYSETAKAYLFHAGSDFAMPEGSVIRVKHEGKVLYAGPDPILGSKVEIDGGDDWSIIYGGLENLSVKEGDRVEPLQAIGQVGYYSGAEGGLSEPHLHFEIWHGDDVQIKPGTAALLNMLLP